MSRWLLAVVVLFVGCLNPMPDDFPQGRDSDGSDDMGSGPALGSAGASTNPGTVGQDPVDNGDSDPAPPNAGGPSIGVEDAGAPLGDGGVSAAEATDAGPPDAGCPGSGVAP